MRVLPKLLIWIFCLLAIGPVVWHGISSLKTPGELTRVPPTYLPLEPTAENYVQLFDRRPFALYLLNSFVIAALSSLVSVGAAALAAYRLARMPYDVRSAVTLTLLVMAFFPPIVFLFPVYELVRGAGLVNQSWSLIVPYAALNLPLAVWLLTGYFERIPIELEEAAAIDGLTPFHTFRKITLPLAGPALVTTGILVFIFAWNEFMFALTFMNMESAKTVTVGIATLSGAFTYEIPWGLLTAGVIVSTLPLIILVLFFQRRIVEGLTAGALK